MKPLIYVAGKWSPDSTDPVEARAQLKANIELAAEHAFKLWKAGASVICPHLNTAFAYLLEFDMPWYEDLGYDVWLNGDFVQVEKADGLFLLPNWAQSRGAKLEKAHALQHGKKVFIDHGEINKWMWERWPRSRDDLKRFYVDA